MNRSTTSLCTALVGVALTACAGDEGGSQDPIMTAPTDSTGAPIGSPGGGGAGSLAPVGSGTGPGMPGATGSNTTVPPGSSTGAPVPPGATGTGSTPVPVGSPTTSATPGAGGAGAPVGAGGMPGPVGAGGTPVGPAGGTPGVGGAPPAGGGAGPAPVDPPPAIPEPTLILSGEGAYWQVGELVAGGSNATVTVNDSQELQDWYGFGGTVNEKGWDAMTHLSEADRDLAIRLLFDKADGAAFTHVRIPIGSSDYALSRYSLAETANDFEMNDFSIERDRQALIPYIKAAQAVNPNLWFWASPWSPPPWMKSNNAFDRGSMKNDAQTMGAHALYLARFVEEYALEGIDVKAIHPQNEAGYEQDYPSCAWSSSQMVDYIANYLAPTFSDRGLPTEIWCGTLSNPSLDHQIGQAVMGNSAARAAVKGVGLQWGLDGSIGTYTNYGVHVMQTEHKCGNYPWETGTYRADRAPNDHAYALESWGFFKTWISGGVNSYMAWNMVLDTIGRSLDDVRPWNQNALLTVDTAQGRLIPTPYYYVFRHLSQYVEPGSVRVQTQGGDALAWKNPDGSIVAVMHNSGGNAADTTLAIGGSTYQFSIPARGWATANWQP